MKPEIEIAIFAATGAILLVAIIAIAIAIFRRTTGKSDKDDLENSGDFPRTSHQQQLPGIPSAMVCARITDIKRSDTMNDSCYVHYDSPKPEPRFCFKNPAFEIDEFITHLEEI